MNAVLAGLLVSLSTTDDARLLVDSMDGRWAGTLTYRDYESDERTQIPVRAQVEAMDSVPGAVRRIEFVDPGRVIESTDLITIEDGTLLLIDPRVGLETESIDSLDVTGPTAWTMVTSARATDDNQPADIRSTITMAGDKLTWRKDVRTSGDWTFRNEIKVRRVDADADALAGTWTIDLRPGPAAAPAPASMIIESVDDGTLAGTYYGSPILNGRVNVSWGRTHFAFVTEDGTGSYHTSGVIEGDRISGTTHSLGREFLSVWSGRRADR